jgi:multisubunit Na+/H+ antiporter MnhG subunit
MLGRHRAHASDKGTTLGVVIMAIGVIPVMLVVRSTTPSVVAIISGATRWSRSAYASAMPSVIAGAASPP